MDLWGYCNQPDSLVCLLKPSRFFKGSFGIFSGSLKCLDRFEDPEWILDGSMRIFGGVEAVRHRLTKK